jgi:hypothetical protein
VILTDVVPKNLEGHAKYMIKEGRVLWVLNIPWLKGRKTRGRRRLLERHYLRCLTKKVARPGPDSDEGGNPPISAA